MANPYQPDYENDDFGDAIDSFNAQVGHAATEESGLARSLVNEMVKSYGFKLNGDGSIEWSLDNIKKAWDDNKLSFLIDYATLLAPVGRFGIAAAKISSQVAKGAEAATTLARAVNAGEFAGKAATSRIGKIATKLGLSGEVAAATELSLARNVAGSGRLAKATYGGLGAKPEAVKEFSRLYAKYGGGAGDALTEAKALAAEHAIGKEVTKQRAVGLMNQVGKIGVSPDDPRFLKALESGPGDDTVRAAAAQLFPEDPNAVAAIAATNKYRTDLQFRAHALGQIGTNTLEETLGEWMPLLRQPYEDIAKLRREAGFRGSRLEVAGARAGAGAAGPVPLSPAQIGAEARAAAIAAGSSNKAAVAAGKTARLAAEKAEKAAEASRAALKAAADEAGVYRPAVGSQIRGGAARLTARSLEPSNLARAMDPASNVAALAQLDDKLSHLEYINKIANSSLSYTSERIGADMLNIVRNNDVAAAAAYGIDKAKLPVIRRLVDAYEELGYKAAGEKIAEHLGWRRMDSKLLKGTEEFLLDKLPGKPMEKWVHPAMAAELSDASRLFAQQGAGKMYSELMTLFRTKSTAWNPSSYMRNAMGAWMYHAAGGGGLAPDAKALAAVLGRGEKELFEAGLARGVIGSGTGTEAFRNALHGVPITEESALSGIKWLGDSKLMNAAKTASGKAEQVYRGIDDVFKLSLFAKQTRKYQKAGYALEKARDLAAAHVAKFSPTFYSPSNFTKLVSQVIPFSGFTSEALRVYKNLATERPIHAMAMAHMVSGLTRVSAAASGLSNAELEAAKQQGLPENMRNGQALLLPFRGANGAPQFLDMSYVVPLATIGQTPLLEQLAAPWNNDLYNVSANPVVGLGAAAATGVDPFTGGKIQPRFLEEQLGMQFADPSARRAAGLMEYVTRTAAPTWAPPGWAATNILEAARGTVDPNTGVPKEESLPRALAGNLFGLKVVAADADNVIQDTHQRQAELADRQVNLWKGWKIALANGRIEDMESARRSLMAEWIAQGSSVAEAQKKFLAGQKSHSQFAGLSTKRLKELLDKLDTVPGADASEARAELFRRFQERRLKAAQSGRKS